MEHHHVLTTSDSSQVVDTIPLLNAVQQGFELRRLMGV